MSDIEKLESIAKEKGATIHKIFHSSAGWAIQWHEKARQGNSFNFKNGLITYRYYPSRKEMIEAEIKRLQLPAKR